MGTHLLCVNYDEIARGEVHARPKKKKYINPEKWSVACMCSFRHVYDGMALTGGTNTKTNKKSQQTNERHTTKTINRIRNVVFDGIQCFAHTKDTGHDLDKFYRRTKLQLAIERRARENYDDMMLSALT